MLEWDARQQMWRERKLPPLNDDFGGTPAEKREFMGANHATLRLGRAMRSRKVDKRNYEGLVSPSRPPCLPVLLEACRQDQFSYEYRHGVTSYGAFTYSLAKDLRARPQITFQQIRREDCSDAPGPRVRSNSAARRAGAGNVKADPRTSASAS
jgi:hypothetical protein